MIRSPRAILGFQREPAWGALGSGAGSLVTVVLSITGLWQAALLPAVGHLLSFLMALLFALRNCLFPYQVPHGRTGIMTLVLLPSPDKGQAHALF